jgi:hypothetical protein
MKRQLGLKEEQDMGGTTGLTSQMPNLSLLVAVVANEEH